MIIEQLFTNNGRYSYPWQATAFRDHFPIDGPKIEYFDLAASDYDRGDDLIVCPCGTELQRIPQDWDDSMAELGWAIRVAEKHLAEAHGRDGRISA